MSGAFPTGIIPRQPVITQLGTVAEHMSATYCLRFDPQTDLDQAVSKLAKVAGVVEVSPVRFRFALFTPNDPMYGLQWGLTKINCPAAWDRTKGSPSVIVAVVDSGVDLNHPDLQANLLSGWDAVDLVGVSPKPGWHFEGDFLTRDNNPQDEVGHGTHVAGIIAALTNNNVGVAGVASNCKILPVKVLARMVRNTDGAVTGTGTSVDIATGIRYAADNGAHIINLSLGGYGDEFVERDAVAYAVGKGCLVVAAMNNHDIGTPSYPAAYPDVVAVGAINQSEQRCTIANTGSWGSNYGPHIDLVAPGRAIRSTVWDNAYDSYDGTSMAAPHVAGVAALLKSCKSSLSAVQIAQYLRNTARPLKDNPSDPVPNDYYGYGLLDAAAAVKAVPYFLDWKKFQDDSPWKKWFDEPKWKKLLDEGGLKLKFTDEVPPKFKKPDDMQAGPAPFMLATPHHSMAWAATSPGASQTTLPGAGNLSQYAAAIAALEMLEQQAGLTEAGIQQLEALRREYQALLEQWQQGG
jgi:subtilisin family serine protease